jgi:hypothetical protein
MNRYLRKLAHKRFIARYISDLHWDTINTVTAASATEWNDSVANHLNNNGILIRKYERRRRWLKF